jgi:hypothetical protein
MKERYSKFLFSAFALLLSIVVLADSPIYEVSGVISDRKTGKNIQEVKVQLERDGEVIIETKTKADGTFVIRIPENDMALGSIKVRVLKRGYKSQIFNTIPGTTNTLDVQLEKLKAIPIMVPKKSPTGQYIIVQNSQPAQVSISNSALTLE